MKKKVIYSLIIDRSSSMYEIKDEIFQSVNQQIAAIQKLAIDTNKEVFVELTMFNNRVQRLIPLTPGKQLQPLAANEYIVNGTTALYDALGSTLERLNFTTGDEIKNELCHVIVVVFTDGYENASRMYTQEDIKRLLANANSFSNVEITLVGCDEDTLMMARAMNFKKRNIVRTSKADLGKSIKIMDDVVSSLFEDKNVNFKSLFKEYDLDKEKDEDIIS